VSASIREHRGRIVKNTGDGFLAEFPSVVDAVRCAAEIQRGMIDREPEGLDERRIRFRIGVNIGDVIVEEHDIFGDGVNVAARLEALAEPGGICVSRIVRDQIRDKLPYAFEDMGEQSVKNIARPVRVYGLRLETVTDLPASMVPSAVSISQTAVAPRLSIVVLPFTNLSDDREQQHFADGITEDLTTDLSRLENMFVISRNTAFTYRNKPIDTKQIGRELGVRYVLEGSVRRSGNQVRVNALLIDAATDAHLWAERFDGGADDLLALQDEVTRRIAVTLNLELVGAEAARLTDNADALDYIFRGRAAMLKPQSRTRFAEAIALFERALGLDPRSVAAQGYLAFELARRVMDGMAAAGAADIARADDLAERALAASPRRTSAFCKRLGVAGAGALLRRHSALRGGARVQSQLGGCIVCIGPMQALRRANRGGYPARRASNPVQPPRSQYGCLVLPDRAGASAAIAHRRGDPLAREGAHRQPGIVLRACLARLCLCPQRRDRTRRYRARHSPWAKRQRSVHKHRSLEGGRSRGIVECPKLVRSHLFRWSAQGRSAGGMITGLLLRATGVTGSASYLAPWRHPWR
jgi:TolB-like protein